MNLQSDSGAGVPFEPSHNIEPSLLGYSDKLLTEEEAEEIIALTDPVQRNLRITQGYHELTMGMTRLLGDANVSWCGFATWASRTAGLFIRGEYVPEIVHSYVQRMENVHRLLHLGHRMLAGVNRSQAPATSLLTSAVERVVRIITENVGWGNHLVFEDMAPLYARMIKQFTGAKTYDQQAIDRFVSSLRPGPIDEGGQDLLIEAMRGYYKAMFEDDPKKKAELILLANNMVGYHEQTRLQEPIVNSLSAPIADWILSAARDRTHELTHQTLHMPLDVLVQRTLRPLSRRLQQEWSNVATRWLMRLELPEVILCLGEDLPSPYENAMFPELLQNVENAELRSMLYELDYTPNTTVGSGARDWGVLNDRMNFVVDFFRSRQQDYTLFRQPFTNAQVEVIRGGGIPDGDL